MATDLRLPQLGDIMTEGRLTAWLQADGAAVEAGQPLYDLETDKVSFTVEAPAGGVLRQVVPAGEVVPVGTVVGQLLAADEPPESLPPREGGGPATAGTRGPREIAVVGCGFPGVGRGGSDIAATPAARALARELGVDLTTIAVPGRIREADVRAAAADEPPESLPPRGGGGPATAGTRGPREIAVVGCGFPGVGRGGSDVAATPAARALARELGVDLTTIAVPGRIREADVRAAAAASAASLPYAGRRRAIGERMLRSHQTTAALTLTSEVRVDAALDLIDELNQAWSAEGVVLTLTRLVVRACALALRDHPLLNARLRDDRIELPGTVDVGLAMDQEAGLVVPVLRGADRLSLRESAAALRELTQRAEAGRLSQAEAGGATFTVTSLAGTVVDAFTPILDPPQAAILGVGRVRAVAGFEGERLARQRVTTLSLTFDHRVADGAPAARFLGRVAELIGSPAELR